MKKGFTLLEVLVSISIISMLAAAVFPVLGWMIAKSKQFQYDSEAATVLLEAMEASYNYLQASTTDWSAITAGPQYNLVQVGGNKWELQPGGPIKVRGRFDQWVTIGEVCRDETTGDYSVKVGSCNSPLVEDDTSRIIYGHVTWEEPTGTKPLDSELLIVRM